jgi:hypothetical protein
VPARCGEIVDQNHRGARIGYLLKGPKLHEFFWVANAGTGPIREHLKEGETERPADSLCDLFAKAIRAARVTARYGGDRVSGPAAMKLPNKGSNQFGSSSDELSVKCPLRQLQCNNVIGLGSSAPGTGGDPPDFIPPKHCRSKHEGPE